MPIKPARGRVGFRSIGLIWPCAFFLSISWPADPMATSSTAMVHEEDKNEEEKAPQYYSFKKEVESLISTKRLSPYEICEHQGYWIDKPFLTGILISRSIFASELATAGANSSMPLEEQLDLFCKGIWLFGPCWDHILEYWKASLESPNKVMFITYEHLKTETHTNVKAMAEFIGLPFSADEEKDGVIQKVIDLCSFDNLKRLDINRSEAPFNPLVPRIDFRNYPFFRQGKVGGYTSLLTKEMIKRINEITELKFKGSGLVFN